MTKLNDEEYELFFRLSSAYHAVAFSAAAPVMFAQNPKSKKRAALSHVFYDCLEDESRGMREMQLRIKSVPDAIHEHLFLHSQMRDGFYSVQESANTNNRNGLIAATEKIYDGLVSYLGLVEAHEELLEEKAFLFYPTCLGSQYFQIPRDDRIAANSFNKGRSAFGLKREVEKMNRLLENIRNSRSRFEGISLTDLTDNGEGFDSSLRGRLELTRELLNRAGYVEGADE